MKNKRCKICKREYVPQRVGQAVCSIDCAMAQSRQNGAKAARKANRARREALLTKADHTKRVQVEFNKFIRTRDQIAGLPCVSCGRHHQGQYHAGHYRTTAAQPALRFNELNCHRQCAPCNNHKSGNITEYRIELVKRLSPSLVDWLEIDHPPCKWTIDELKALRTYYKDATKALLASCEVEQPF